MVKATLSRLGSGAIKSEVLNKMEHFARARESFIA